MKNKIIIFILLFIFIFNSNAQTLDWANSINSPQTANGASIVTDLDGNIYTVGWYYGTADFDPGAGVFNMTAVDLYDGFIQKMDPDGNFIWAKSLGGPSYEFSTTVAVDSNNAVYVCGHFDSQIDLDPGATTQNYFADGQHIFITKLDENGNFIWAKTIGNTATTTVNCVKIDKHANLHLTGEFGYNLDFDPGPGVYEVESVDYSAAYTLKIDSTGQFIWVRTIQSESIEVGRSVSVDENGNVYTCGNFFTITDFDPGATSFQLSSYGGSDIFIQKLDENGNFIWARKCGGTGSDYPYSSDLDEAGNLFLTGSFVSTIFFDPPTPIPNPTSNGGSDVFILKTATTGNTIWFQTFGGTGNDVGNSISVDVAGNVYSTGSFQNSIDLDPSSSGASNFISNGEEDIFIQKLDQSGNYVWGSSFGAGASDIGEEIVVNDYGIVHTTGKYFGTVDFDPQSSSFYLSSLLGPSAFIQRILQCSDNVGIDTKTACNSYTWIDGNTYTQSNNSAQFTVSNMGGCDSVITLNLTINSVSDLSTTIVNETSIQANNESATYQWINCANNSSIFQANDQIFSPVINGNYAVQLIENGCTDTSECVSISTIGINELMNIGTIKVFPNPFHQQFTIELEDLKTSSIMILRNLNGQIIMEREIQNSSTIVISDLDKGVYFLEIWSNNLSEFLKIIAN